MKQVKILNVPIDNLTMSELLAKLKHGGVVFTPNVDHLIKLQKDQEFYQIYQTADYRVCDSQVLLFAAKFLGQPIQEKISGSDLFPAFYQYYKHDKNVTVFLLGAPEGVAYIAQQRINYEVGRQMVVDAYCPPYGFEHNPIECQKIVDLINQSGATVLAVGVGAPKQEKWIHKYKNQLKNVKVFFAVGATIEFEAGYRPRAPQWVSKTGLEWLYRLILEPKRLGKRYLIDDLPFFGMLLQQKLNFNAQRTTLAMKQLKITMLGPNLAERGGMGSVGTLIMNSAPVEVQMQYISTWEQDRSQESSLAMLQVFSRSLIVFLGQLLKGEVDLVHIHMAERGSALRKSLLILLALAFRKPVIVHAHGCEFHEFHHQLPKLGKAVLNSILQKCTYLVALSESWQQFYVKYCGLKPEQVVVLPNPVALPSQIPQRGQSEQLNLVFLGKINQRKGVFDLLQAFAQIPPQQRAKANLILAGSGSLEQARKLAQSLQIEQQVSFPGWINSEQRNELLTQADIFLLPSYNEGLPMALLEAMSWELPVITTPVGGIPELVTHKETGWLVKPGDIEQLTVAMQSLLTDTTLRLEMGNAARKQVAPLNIDQYSHFLFDLYRSALDSDQYQNAEIRWLKKRLAEEQVVRQQLQQDWEQLNTQVNFLQDQLEKQQQTLQDALTELKQTKERIAAA